MFSYSEKSVQETKPKSSIYLQIYLSDLFKCPKWPEFCVFSTSLLMLYWCFSSPLKAARGKMGVVIHSGRWWEHEDMPTNPKSSTPGRRTASLFPRIFSWVRAKGWGENCWQISSCEFHQLVHLHPDLHQAGGQVFVFEMACSVLAVPAVNNGMPRGAFNWCCLSIPLH